MRYEKNKIAACLPVVVDVCHRKESVVAFTGTKFKQIKIMKKFVNSDLFAVMTTIAIVVLFITIGALVLDSEPNGSKKPKAKASIELCGTHAILVKK